MNNIIKNITKKGLALLLIAILFCSVFMPLSTSKIYKIQHNETFSIELFENSVVYVKSLSSYEYGLGIGKEYRSTYKLLDFLTFMKKDNKIDEKETKNQLLFLEQSCPVIYEQLRGLSDGLNIKMERLLKISEFVSSIFSGQCTVTLSTGNATKNNNTFLTFNVDTKIEKFNDIFMLYVLRLMTYKPYVAKINSIEYSYVYFGIPILYEWPILNEKGLGWGEPGTTFTKNDSRYIDTGPGIATYMLDRLTMMTCKNVSEVVTLWKTLERASGPNTKWPHFWDGSTSGWCDKEGGIALIEQTHNYIKAVFRNSTNITNSKEDILWHSNHHIWLDPNLTGSLCPEESLSSDMREKRTHELLLENYGNITLETCKMICRDHGGGFDTNKPDSGDICRHFDKNYPSTTAFSWIIMPKDLTIYITHRHPCKSTYWKYDFSKIFEK